MKTCISILAALLLSSCASNPTIVRSEEDLEADRVNAVADFSALTASQPLLAVEIEITANEVRLLDARILFAPRTTDSAVPELRVRANGVEGWEYTIANPLIAHVDDPENPQMIVLESARIPVFLPLSAALTSITIEPVAERDAPVRGGTFDVRKLAAQACARMRSSIAACREIESRLE